jgi:hypothetical protein
MFGVMVLLLGSCNAKSQEIRLVQIQEYGLLPNLAIDPSSNIHLVWTNGTTMYMVLDTLGNTISPPVQCSGAIVGLPLIAFAREFGLMSFSRSAGFNAEVYGRIAFSDAPPDTNQFLINEPYWDASRFPSESDFVDDSTVLILWAGQGPRSIFEGGLYGQVVRKSGRVSGPDWFLCDTVVEGQRLLSPKFGVSTKDNSIWVTWLDDNPVSKKILYRRFSHSGVPLSDIATLVGSGFSDTLWSPTIEVSRDNRICLAWSEKRAGIWSVYAQLLDETGQKSGPTTRLNEDSVSAYSEVRLTSLGTGTVFAVWEGIKLGHLAVFGTSLEGMDTVQSHPFLVLPHGDSLDQSSPAVQGKGSKVFVFCKRGSGLVLSIIDITLTSVESDGRGSPGNLARPGLLSLKQNYPNPFNPTTNIEYTLREPAKVRLSIFDILGREIRVLDDALKARGTHRVLWNVGNLPSGVYICHAVASFDAIIESASNSMILLK